MRTPKLLSLVVVVCSWAATASAQKVGDKIVVTTDDAPLRSQEATTGTVRKGNMLVVEHVNGDRLTVTWSGPKGTVKGWIKRSDIIPFSQALDFFTEELKRNRTPKAYTIRGAIRAETGETESALADYSEAIRIDPKYAFAYYDRGIVWLTEKQYDKALSDFGKTIQIDPKIALAYYGRGNAWTGKGKLDKAILDYNEAIRLDPKCALLYCGRGGAWFENEDYDKALADFKEAIRLDPTYALTYGDWLADTHVTRGEIWQAKGDIDKALTYFSEAIRLRPKDPSAFEDRGRAWLEKKEYGKAISDFNEAIRINPKDHSSLASRAWVAATCPDARYRDGKKAVGDATRACELIDWKVSDYLDTLAAAYAETSDFLSAVKWQEKAIALAPEELTGELRSRLDLYKAHKPYRVEPKK